MRHSAKSSATRTRSGSCGWVLRRRRRGKSIRCKGKSSRAWGSHSAPGKVIPAAGETLTAWGSHSGGRRDSHSVGKSFPRQGRLIRRGEVIPTAGETLPAEGSRFSAKEDSPRCGKSFQPAESHLGFPHDQPRWQRPLPCRQIPLEARLRYAYGLEQPGSGCSSRLIRPRCPGFAVRAVKRQAFGGVGKGCQLGREEFAFL
jgi:hypothetical protein